MLRKALLFIDVVVVRIKKMQGGVKLGSSRDCSPLVLKVHRRLVGKFSFLIRNKVAFSGHPRVQM